jgi:predicted permease
MSEMLRERAANAGAANPPAVFIVDSLRDAHFRDQRPQLQLLLAVAGVVVLLSLTNIVIAAMAQAISRRRETAVRVALGGSAWRLFIDTAQENAITAVVAGAAGLGLGIWLTDVVILLTPPQWMSRVPGQAAAVRLDSAVFLTLVGILTVVTLSATFTIQWFGRHIQPWCLLSTTLAPQTRASRLAGMALVAAEIALCTCAVGTGSVLVQQLFALRSVDLGIDADRATAAWLNLSPSKFATDESRVAHYDAILGRIRNIPDVEAAGGVDLPFHFDWQLTRVRIDGAGDSGISALSRAATDDYLKASGIDVIAGRWFDVRDRRGGPPVAVVSEGLARALWPNGPSLGREVRIGNINESAGVATVIGVVNDTRHAPYRPPDRTVYRPMAQAPPAWLYLIVKSRRPTVDLAPALSQAVWSVDPDQPIDGPWPVAEWAAGRTDFLRFAALLTGVLAIVGAVLAAAGLYGLTAFWVGQATPDLGIRRAIGADDRAIARWFGMRCVAVVLPGVTIGALLLFGGLRLVSAAIDGVGLPSWPQSFFAIALVLICSLCAVAVPLRRALRVNAAALMRGDV